jgi:energy-coupling factor transporter ATP-binding protein EcfA2
MLDNTRLRGELAHIHRTLSAVAAGPRGKGFVDHLRREIDATTAAALWQALFADCMRVAYTAAAADGVIGDDEVAALYEFVFSVARHYAGVLPRYREFAAVDEESARQFLEHYATDSGPFGERATLHWPGLTLCRRAAELGDSEALERYERMMSWLIPAACEIGGVTEADPRWTSRVAELHGLRRTLATTAGARPGPAADPRLKAFLATTGVFAGVQQASSMFESDPFDVEKIHPDARTSFEQMVERAINPEQHSGRGRILLVLGESGAGKTHLLRGFRRHVHEYGRGFVAYAQMSSASGDYARYLLHHVIDSLSMPYTGPSGERTGLLELAVGLSRLAAEPLKSKILELAEGNWDTQDNLCDYVNRLVDELLALPVLARFDPDLLRVLLYVLHPDQRTTARAYRYLLCEDMNAYDRQWLGDITPRTREDQPSQMIRDLARLAYLTRQATLVLMIDQAELSGFDAATAGPMFQRAINALYSIVSEIPSAIAVVACLKDLYDKVHSQLGRAMIDRLEKDPPFEWLRLNRSYPEIEAIVGRRLSWLYAQAGVAYKPDDPVFPIPAAALRNLVNLRTRDVLQWCHQFHTRCATAKQLVDTAELGITSDEELPGDADLDQIAAQWNDASHAPGIEVPDSAEGILVAIAAAAGACADELGLSVVAPPRKNGVLRLQLAGATQRAELAISITNHGYQRGAFGTQLEALREAAGEATAVAVRTLEFPKGPACNAAVAKLIKDGGRKAYVDGSALRTIAALQRFQPAFPQARVAAWRRRDRPISTLGSMIALFDLERLRGDPALVTAVADPAHATTTPPTGTPIVAAPGDRATARLATTPPTGVAVIAAGDEPATDDRRAANGKPSKLAVNGTATAAGPHAALGSQLRIGTASTFGAEPRTIEVSSLLRHTGILGSSGSGKTTLALNLIEQVLERDVAVVLVDRKGDLAGYAKPDWWKHTADPDRARRLAERLDVRLFTPGTRGGRPLSLSVVPDLQQIPDHERDRVVQFAGNALAAMMHLGNGKKAGACRAILTQAIAVLAERNQACGLRELIGLIDARDDQLLARAARYDDKLFKDLVQDLDTVRLGYPDLFDPAAEPLTAETLIGRKPGGKVPLAIASTRFLGDIEQIQSWVAHLIGCLNRHAAKSPSAELRAIFMIDEADVFMPAGAAKPPSKEPLQDLLKRARAAGLGIVLASQSPADFDYRSREQINTWFLGRIADQRSIDKMKPLFEHRPAVAGKLGTQDAGRFVMLQDGGAIDLGRTPSLLRTEQLAETELMELAARLRVPA